MADIELVIKIPEEVYRYAKKYNVSPVLALREIGMCMNAIANGTPLPKGHGKLICEPTEEDITKTVGGQNDFTECIKDAVKAVFGNATAIIDADKESEE